MSQKTVVLYQPPGHGHTLCGAAKDGTVRLSKVGCALVGGPLSPEEARKFGYELIASSNQAVEFIAQANGEHLWCVVAVAGEAITMRHRGATAQMRPIVNGRRRRGSFWRCTICDRSVQTGARMWVCEGVPPFRWGRPRICAEHTTPNDPIERLALLVSFEPARST